MLSCVLSDPGVRSFLEGMGYPSGFRDSDALDLLAQRMSEGMQHEIGIFLGYPLRDVEGFLENGGRTFNHLTGGNLTDQLIRELFNRSFWGMFCVIQYLHNDGILALDFPPGFVCSQFALASEHRA